MGTTIVVVVAFNNLFYLGHIGDSRIYSYHNKTLKCLTKDHSLVQQLIESGELSLEDAKKHPMRNVITRAVGTSFDPDEDYFDGVLQLPENAYLLMCSDGLNGMITEKQMTSAFSMNEPENISHSLVDMAINAGGLDNITVSVVKVKECNKMVYSFNQNSVILPKSLRRWRILDWFKIFKIDGKYFCQKV